jgi:membrane protease YdiL (CAAX protease family)
MRIKGDLSVPAVQPNWYRGMSGVRAGWRLGRFILLMVLIGALQVCLQDLLVRAFWHGKSIAWADSGLMNTPLETAIQELGNLLPALGATVMMALAEDTKLSTYGLGLASWRWLVNGSAVGLLWLCCLMLLLVRFGLAWVSPGGMSWPADIRYGLEWLIASLLIGVSEELLCRGYLLHGLTRGIGFWPAALGTSLFFMYLHTGNDGETRMGLLDIFTSGLLWCITIRATGSLWWAIGSHGLWDFGENFIFGSADSGFVTAHTLLHTVPYGPVLWSGGVTGPEGSILSEACTGLVAVIFLLWKRVEKPTSPRSV